MGTRFASDLGSAIQGFQFYHYQRLPSRNFDLTGCTKGLGWSLELAEKSCPYFIFYFRFYLPQGIFVGRNSYSKIGQTKSEPKLAPKLPAKLWQNKPESSLPKPSLTAEGWWRLLAAKFYPGQGSDGTFSQGEKYGWGVFINYEIIAHMIQNYK